MFSSVCVRPSDCDAATAAGSVCTYLCDINCINLTMIYATDLCACVCNLRAFIEPQRARTTHFTRTTRTSIDPFTKPRRRRRVPASGLCSTISVCVCGGSPSSVREDCTDYVAVTMSLCHMRHAAGSAVWSLAVAVVCAYVHVQ